MFQGSESLEKLAHFRHVQSSGGVFNGSTHQDYTDYFEVLPAAALERALFLEADRLRAPKLTHENLRNQVDVVKEEIRLNVLNRPYGGFPWILLPPVLYDTFPNAHNGYGDFSELEQASLDDAAAFFDTFYAPGNAQLTVAGYLDVDDDAAAGREALRRHPGPRHPGRARRSPSRRPPANAGRRCPTAHAPLPALALGYRMPDPAADLDGYLGHALLASVLGDGEAARLQRRLVHARRYRHRHLGRGRADGAAGRARPGHVHHHRGAPGRGRSGPGAGRGGRGAGQAGRGRAGPRGAGAPGGPLVGRAPPGERPGDVPDARARRPGAALRPGRDRHGAAGPAGRGQPGAGAGRGGRAALVGARRAARRAAPARSRQA